MRGEETPLGLCLKAQGKLYAQGMTQAPPMFKGDKDLPEKEKG